jgi:hypothetical protein
MKSKHVVDPQIAHLPQKEKLMDQRNAAQGQDLAEIDLVWGVKAIAQTIHRTQRQTFHLCSIGALPTKKVGNRWVAEKNALRRFFQETAA